ncbi:FUSC family protein [Microbacterium sp. W1N]|uniref:FUSC family protein n=1 Tax=Microbacterium festucae TaxID=2977531 RepID=UPI0021BED1C9|nr:FUSC family protein [Microbacterium festucae]MCT9819217.1 FUSC family protein [Microbacterium festucae]
MPEVEKVAHRSADRPRVAATPGGMAWSWRLFGLGVVFAVPAAVVALWQPGFGLAVAVGTVPAAINRLAPLRSARVSVVVVGVGAGLSLVAGALLTQVPAVAVAVLFLLGPAAALGARTGRLGAMALALGLPLVGIGLSISDVATALALGGVMAVASVYAWLVSLLWPAEDPEPESAPAPPPLGRRAALAYGILLGTAGALAAGIGYALGLEHVGWATGACLLVMRPHRSLLFSRSIGRALSVLVGALAAALFALAAPQPWAIAAACMLVLAAATATQRSRWYVAPGFTTFLALSMIMHQPGQSPAVSFQERVGETLLGVALALLFGWGLPAALTRLVRRSPARL